ncbi:LysR family transcriptional regulator [Streptomyces sp. NBC_01166]|uniref:LysR family transcriptional regulator n=1 Tax=Streptomyces sp. NBC_01166 TaxID=2903755 RepID=UPI003869AB5A|nr:LysR family transcriptional regulator [Streptomyces sp. NBC_01166]
MVDLETRELEYFVAVAEELHFGRAAQRLSIAQPALSKAVRRVESRLGVQLLLRSSRHVSLTPAGEALLHHGRHALNAVAAASRNARRAGETRAHLRLVIKAGGDAGLLSGILARYSLQPDARQVDILFGGATDRVERLHDGRADVALLHTPFDDLTGLAHETLHVEGRVAILPRDHRLASRTELRLRDLEHETLPRWRGVSDGGTGPEIADVAQMMQMIVLGRTIAVLPRSLVEPVPPGVVCVPVTDAPASHLVLAWPETDRRPLVASFVEAAVAADPPRRDAPTAHGPLPESARQALSPPARPGSGGKG